MAPNRRIFMDCKKRSVGSLFKNDKGHAFYQPSFYFTLYTCHDNLNHPVDKTIKRYSKIKITVICALTAFFMKCNFPYPKLISVLSPMFKERVSPITSVSLPIRESSSITSYNFEKDPIMDALIIEE